MHGSWVNLLRGAVVGLLIGLAEVSANISLGDSEYSLVFEGIGCLPACSSNHHKRFADAKIASNLAFVVQDQINPAFTLAKCKQTCTDAGRLCGGIYMYTNKYGTTICNGLKYVGSNNNYASKQTDKVDYSFVKVGSHAVKSCEQLGWRRSYDSHGAELCGTSVPGIAPSGSAVCHKNVGHAVANSVCRTAGARLCSAEEVQGGAVAGGACSFNAELVWTDTPCYLSGTDSYKTHGFFTTRGGGNGHTSCQLATGSVAAAGCCAGGWNTPTFQSAPPPTPPPLRYLPPPLPPSPSRPSPPSQIIQLQTRAAGVRLPSPPPPPFYAQPFNDSPKIDYQKGVAAPTSTGAPTTGFPRDVNGDILLPVGQRVYVLWGESAHYFATVVAARPPGEFELATYDVSFEEDRSMGYYLTAEQHVLTPVGGVNRNSGSFQHTGTPKTTSKPPVTTRLQTPPPRPPPPAVHREISGSDGRVLMSDPIDGSVSGIRTKASTGSRIARFIKWFLVATVASVLIVLAIRHNGACKRLQAARAFAGTQGPPRTPETESHSSPEHDDGGGRCNGGRPEQEPLEPTSQRVMPPPSAPFAPLTVLMGDKPPANYGTSGTAIKQPQHKRRPSYDKATGATGLAGYEHPVGKAAWF